MRRAISPGSPVVVKVGSSGLLDSGGGLDEGAIGRVAGQVSGLWDVGYPTVLVSSGAVAAGLPLLGLTKRPDDLPSLQVAAAVGQGRLMERYAAEFRIRGRVAGQVLVTKDVLANREQYLHARRALRRMLEAEVVPVVNENDTVAVEELRMGDNDRLAALVSHLVTAGVLVILTDAPGLLTGDPRVEEDTELLGAVRHTDEILDRVARGVAGPHGSGGMATKVAAARMAAWSGIPTVIAQATDPSVLERVAAGEEVGTWVEPRPERLASRKLWIAFGQPAEGRVVVDRGAAEALVHRGGSLLPVGITAVEGDFPPGAGVEVVGGDGALIAKGLVRRSSAEIRSALGRQGGGEVVHRDDLVVLVT